MNIQFWQEFFRKENLAQILTAVLAKFGIPIENEQALSWEFLYGGLRKVCLKVKLKKQKEFLCVFWPKQSIEKKRVIKSLEIEEKVGRKGIFKTRRWLPKKLLKIKIGKYWFWVTLLSNIPGKSVFPFQPSHVFSAGEALASLHQAFLRKDGSTLLHLDFVRGNILFDDKNKVCGVLDFEEACWGEPEKDIACALSFLIVDCQGLTKKKIEKRLLDGYQKDGKIKPNLRKVKDYLRHYLRRKEMGKTQKSSPKFLQEAKERWTAYQRKIKAKMVEIKDLAKIRKKQKDSKIVFALGAWELIHWGHIAFLREAKRKGDILVVGVATNQSRRRLKGVLHPLVSESTRAETLAYFPFVDWVVICDEDNAIPVFKKLKPDIFFTAKSDWKEGLRSKKEEELIKKFKGETIKKGHLKPNVSSSDLVRRVALKKVEQTISSLWKEGLDSPLLKPQALQKIKAGQLILFKDEKKAS